MVFVIFFKILNKDLYWLGQFHMGNYICLSEGENNPKKQPTSCRLSYVVPLNKVTICLIKLPPLISLFILMLNLLSYLPVLMSNYNFLLPKG